LVHAVLHFLRPFGAVQAAEALALDEDEPVVGNVDPQVGVQLLAALGPYRQPRFAGDFLPVRVTELLPEEVLDPTGQLRFGEPLQALEVGALLLERCEEGGLKFGEGFHGCTLHGRGRPRPAARRVR
jgi:hypothetical protein